MAIKSLTGTLLLLMKGQIRLLRIRRASVFTLSLHAVSLIMLDTGTQQIYISGLMCSRVGRVPRLRRRGFAWSLSPSPAATAAPASSASTASRRGLPFRKEDINYAYAVSFNRGSIIRIRYIRKTYLYYNVH